MRMSEMRKPDIAVEGRDMSTALRVIKHIKPKTALEKKLYAFYKKWMKWFNDEYKARDKVFPEDVDFRSEEYTQWSRKYAAAHPKPKIPKALLIDFSDRRLGSSLGARLWSGYYRRPKAVVVSGEYGTSVWLIKKHADFGSVAVELVTKLDTVFVVYPVEHEERPPNIEPSVLDALPAPYRDEVIKKHDEDVASWLRREEGIVKAEKIAKLVEQAKKGDQVAAATLIYDFDRDDCYYGEGSKIEVVDFENVEPS